MGNKLEDCFVHFLLLIGNSGHASRNSAGCWQPMMKFFVWPQVIAATELSRRLFRPSKLEAASGPLGGILFVVKSFYLVKLTQSVVFPLFRRRSRLTDVHV